METTIKNQNLNDVNFMKQYLKDVYTLEKELYCSQQAKNKLTNIINGLGHPKQIEVKGSNSSYIVSAIGNGIGGAVISLLIGGFIGFVLSWILDSFLHLGFLPLYICAILGGLYGFCSCFSDSKYRTEQKNGEYWKSQKEIKEDKERVEKEKALIPQYRNTENLYLQNISSCKNALNQLYSLDIIFPKYRNFVAISQIYEYFMSGRCSQLEGHEGAYNIYESELRQNVIISQLNDVLNQLEQIKQNQYMIYDAICEANNRLAHIENNTEAIKYNTAVIAENSAICARYADSRVY